MFVRNIVILSLHFLTLQICPIRHTLIYLSNAMQKYT
jgi:hypothetical protein